MSEPAEKKCAAGAFRASHPGQRLSVVGYSVAPPEIEAQYRKLVKVEVHNLFHHQEEVHRCHCCSEIVFEATHA